MYVYIYTNMLLLIMKYDMTSICASKMCSNNHLSSIKWPCCIRPKELLLGLQDLQGTPHRINGLGVVLKKSDKPG